jgi:predicted MPP superfamily phosphohydrolase
MNNDAVNPRRFSRRHFLLAAVLSCPAFAVADAKWLEPGWVRIRRIRFNKGKHAHRFVHFTDVHHKGDRAYLQSVVRKINAISPEFVCFTGDLIEQRNYLAEALEILARIKSPLYGVPGNHDYWSKAPFDPIAACFAATGGGWLVEQQQVTQDRKFSIIGAACLNSKTPPIQPNSDTRNIFLMHYPAWVENLRAEKYDLILAGHSHGGQVRLPIYGPLFVPFGVGRFDLGMFRTKQGPLYVNPGIGWFPVPIRFNCRPEITVFEI